MATTVCFTSRKFILNKYDARFQKMGKIIRKLQQLFLGLIIVDYFQNSEPVR